MNTLVFDIETVPDVELGRRLYDLDGLDDAAVAKAMFAQAAQRCGRTTSCRRRNSASWRSRCCCAARDGLKIFSLGDEQSPEKELVQRFFDGLERYSPVLVSWNGSGFDLPVLNYRALRHGVNAHRYWEVGEHDRDFRYNNYLEPLSLAAHRSHGRAVGLRRERPRVARARVAADRLAGQARDRRRARVVRVSARRACGDSRLLRNRRAEYLPHLSALRADARRARCRGATRRSSRSSKRSSRNRIGRICSSISSSGRRRGMRADGAAIVTTIIDLTHDGVGVADIDGRRVFVADALPGERVEIVLRKRRRKLQEADLTRVLEPSPSRVVPAVRVLRPLRRLRAAASGARGAGVVQAARRRRDAEAHRPSRARGMAAARRQPAVGLPAPRAARRQVCGRQEPRARRLPRARGPVHHGHASLPRAAAAARRPARRPRRSSSSAAA